MDSRANNSWAMMETDRCPQSMDSRQFDALERGPRSTRFFNRDIFFDL